MVNKMQDIEYIEIVTECQPPSMQDLEEYENLEYMLEEAASNWQYYEE